MVRTEGLTHIHFAVDDLERSLRFYQQVFGMEELFRQGQHMIFLRTPGSGDMITLHSGEHHAGESGGIAHFGFQLAADANLDEAVTEVETAGGKLVSRGHHGAGYAYVADPDGYVIELMGS